MPIVVAPPPPTSSSSSPSSCQRRCRAIAATVVIVVIVLRSPSLRHATSVVALCIGCAIVLPADCVATQMRTQLHSRVIRMQPSHAVILFSWQGGMGFCFWGGRWFPAALMATSHCFPFISPTRSRRLRAVPLLSQRNGMWAGRTSGWQRGQASATALAGLPRAVCVRVFATSSFDVLFGGAGEAAAGSSGDKKGSKRAKPSPKEKRSKLRPFDSAVMQMTKPFGASPVSSHQPAVWLRRPSAESPGRPRSPSCAATPCGTSSW